MTTSSLSLDAKQRTAIEAALDRSRPIVAVSGPAGSGKTSLIRIIIEAEHKCGRSVGAMAPTGKAARRVTQATGFAAMTIHRGLEYTSPYETDIKEGKDTRRITVSEPRRDGDNPLPYDTVIVDEYAMVGQELHRNLFDALKRPSVIRVFGDVHQLKPIEERVVQKKQASPFLDLLTRFRGIELDTVHRQMGDSGILYNAHRILNKKLPERRPDYSIEITKDTLRTLRRLVASGRIDYSKPNAQIITPSNKTLLGTYKLNILLQGLYMKGRREVLRPERHESQSETPIRLFVGDKVIFTKNDYALGVFNGETGYLLGYNQASGELTIELDDRIVHVPNYIEAVTSMRVLRYNPQKNIDLAYALTTHKCQGSEYDYVIYIMSKYMMFVQSRANWYTAITRARKGVIQISDAWSFTHVLSKEST